MTSPDRPAHPGPVRDFVGYGPQPPDFDWPGGARIAINLVVNYEEGGEYSLNEDGVNDTWGEYSFQYGPGIRDIGTETHMEYGSRVGIWRLCRLIDRYQIPVTFSACALAGHHSKPLLGTEDDDFDAIMAVNLRGPFMLCRAAVRQMLTQPPRGTRGGARGRIVNITSQHGMVGAPGHAAYAVSKAGLIQLTRQIAVEYGRDGIICNGVAPGKVVTGTPGDLSRNETTAAYVRSRTPFGWFGEPEDVAAAVAFLASDDATYISGATLMVDGGWMAY